MARCRFLIVSLLVGLFLLPAAHPSEPEVVVTKHRGTWEVAYGVVLFRIVGEIENVAKKPVPYVRMAVELLGPDEGIVLERIIYNQRAEPLATIGDEDEAKRFHDSLEPLGPGSKDSFRAGFAKDDLPEGARLAGYRLRLLEPSGESVTEFSAPETTEGRTNLNTATEEELLALPGIDASRAAAILRHRNTHGAFVHPAELRAIPQVAPVWEELAPRVTVH